MEIYYQAIGWVGMTFIVISYCFVTTGRWGTHTKIDEVFNIIGSIMVGINVFHFEAWPAFTLQVVWAVVAIGSLTKKFLQRGKQEVV